MEDRQMQNALLINKLAKSHGIKFTQVDKKKCAIWNCGD